MNIELITFFTFSFYIGLLMVIVCVMVFLSNDRLKRKLKGQIQSYEAYKKGVVELGVQRTNTINKQAEEIRNLKQRIKDLGGE